MLHLYRTFTLLSTTTGVLSIATLSPLLSRTSSKPLSAVCDFMVLQACMERREATLFKEINKCRSLQKLGVRRKNHVYVASEISQCGFFFFFCTFHNCINMIRLPGNRAMWCNSNCCCPQTPHYFITFYPGVEVCVLLHYNTFLLLLK